MFTHFYRDEQWNLFFTQGSLSWMHLLAVKAILSARRGTCRHATSLIRCDQTNPAEMVGHFCFFMEPKLGRCLCFNSSTFLQPISESCWHTWAHSTAQELLNTAPPAATLLLTAQYLSGSPRGRRRQRPDWLFRPCTHVQQREDNLGRGKKVRRMLRDAASAHYDYMCAPKQKQWKH